MKVFETYVESTEMKIRDAFMPGFGIYSHGYLIGFGQIEWENRWGLSELTQTLMLLPWRWTESS